MKDSFFKQFKKVRSLHWFIDCLLIVFGLWAGGHLGAADFWTDVQYKTYQILNDLHPRKPNSRETAVLLIDDEDYWKGELARRVPIKRDYLAKLILKLHDSRPDLMIALDFNFRSPDPEGKSYEHQDYQKETNQLSDAINTVSRNGTKIILPRTLSWANSKKNKYIIDNWIFGEEVSCSKTIVCGYISLPYDIRKLPTHSLQYKNLVIESFSIAIARAYNFKISESKSMNKKELFTSYIPDERFVKLESSKMLGWSKRELKTNLKNKNILIIGAGWHKNAYKKGKLVDSYLTPLGTTLGVFIHANYVEAILDKRIVSGDRYGVMFIFEIIASLITAIVLALNYQYKFRLIFAMIISFLFFSYFSLMNLGFFCDFFIPVFLLLLHYVVGTVLEWKEKSSEYEKNTIR